MGRIPGFSNSVRTVIALCDSDDGVSMNTLARHVESDPALTAAVLRAANSPIYGLARQVGSVKLALVLMGMNELRAIALGVGVFGALSDNLPGGLREHLWNHSLYAAATAGTLARRIGIATNGEVFVAGLLHDIGRLALLKIFGKDYEALGLSEEQDLMEREEDLFGCAHPQAGGWLAEEWRFPETLLDAIVMHHNIASEMNSPKDPLICALVQLSELVCAVEKGNGQNGNSLDSLVMSESWDSLRSSEELPLEQRKEILTDLLKGKAA